VSDWTVEQAAELVAEQFIYLLDGCDDGDTVRPAMVFAALKEIWAPTTDVERDDGITAGQVRERAAAARRRLAEGERIR
jgi:hypothetical protein